MQSQKEYEKLLDNIYKNLPENILNKERFELPVVESMIQGKKTIIRNFAFIAKAVHREIDHLYKFVSKEAGTMAAIDEGKLVLSGKYNQIQLDKIFKSYFKEFVLCSACGKPDTKIIEQSGIKMLKCTACGALSPIRKN
ncbi:MAG: translation initiation factor IF-2 subunit beta [archaeon]